MRMKRLKAVAGLVFGLGVALGATLAGSLAWRNAPALAFAPAPLPRDRPEGPVKAKARTYREEVARFDSLGSVESVAFSPDGARVAAGLSEVRLWDRKTKKVLRRWPKPKGWGFINALAFTRDGKTLGAAGGSGLPGDHPVVLWDVATGQRVVGLGKRGGMVHGFAFSPDGKRAALAGSRLDAYDTATGKLVWSEDASNTWGVAYSPDGRTLAALDLEQAVTLRSAATGKVQARMGGGGGTSPCSAGCRSLRPG